MSAGLTAGTQETNSSVRAGPHVGSSGIIVCTLQSDMLLALMKSNDFKHGDKIFDDNIYMKITD
jgi:hypothetical protein